MSDLEGFGFILPHWAYWGWLAVMPLLILYFEKRWRSEPEKFVNPEGTLLPEGPTPEEYDGDYPVFENSNIVTRVIDWISEQSGVFVAFWTVNAVCFYFYGVIMRYIFNMPSIWVHEASFLLLGMQYMLAGAYAMLHGAHVRVDVLYIKLPPRGRIGMDIFTSVFFFIFALALVSTSWTFFSDSYSMSEITVETWGIQYWPVKAMMLLGALLILLAGLSKLIKDVRLYMRMAPGRRTTTDAV